MDRAHQNTMRDPRFQRLLAEDGVQWKFNPSAAPHFGGLWEAGVKSVKSHLKRVLLDLNPTIEEMSTMLCQIEAVLNSRSLGALHDDIDDLSPLTPGHFLIGGPLIVVPQPSLIDMKIPLINRLKTMQQRVEKFWKVWSRDYLQSLQHRTKWQNRRDAIQVGEMVLLRRGNLPPTKWPLARILEVFPDS